MKEILKYLRQTNSFTQEEIARQLGISRQSYSKYENGEVEPGDKVIQALSLIYMVSEDFIRKNEVPKPGQEEKYPLYDILESGPLYVTDPAAAYETSSGIYVDSRRIFEGIFDGTAVRILDSIESLKLKKGQKVKLYIESEEEEMKERKAAFDRFMKTVHSAKPLEINYDDDPYYKKAINAARDEYLEGKYES